MTDGTALREIAVEILTEILEKGQYAHLALFQALSKYQYLEKADRSFLKRIVDGTVYEYRKDSESTYRREGGSPIWKSRI